MSSTFLFDEAVYVLQWQSATKLFKQWLSVEMFQHFILIHKNLNKVTVFKGHNRNTENKKALLSVTMKYICGKENAFILTLKII